MEPRGWYRRNIGLIVVINENGIQPSTKQSHPRLLKSVAMAKNFDSGWAQSAIDCQP